MADDKSGKTEKESKVGTPRRRNYSDFFVWPENRQLEEWAIVDALKESLERANAGFFHSVVARGQGNDPPDCEALLHDGGKAGIEVTELVDTAILMAHMNGDTARSAQWSREKLITALIRRLEAKNVANHIKGGPYDLYMLVIHTGEPELSYDYVSSILSDYAFNHYPVIQQAFLLMSYEDKYKCCPYLELRLKSGKE